jgi:hypothetical protein
MAPPLDPIASLRAALRGHYDIEREIGQGAFATAQAEYYLWVDSTPDSQARWTLLELSKVTDFVYAALPKNLNSGFACIIFGGYRPAEARLRVSHNIRTD